MPDHRRRGPLGRRGHGRRRPRRSGAQAISLLVPDLTPGDLVLVGLGTVLGRVDPPTTAPPSTPIDRRLRPADRPAARAPPTTIKEDTPCRIPRTTGWGIGLAAATAVISGVSIFVNGLVVKSFADPVALTGARNALVGLVLLGILVATGGAGRGPGARPALGRGLLALAVIGGSVPFILFFSGLAEATGPGAAFIHKTLFIWVAALAMVFLGERSGSPRSSRWRPCSRGVVLVGPSGAPSAGPAGADDPSGDPALGDRGHRRPTTARQRGRQRPAGGHVADGPRRGR